MWIEAIAVQHRSEVYCFYPLPIHPPTGPGRRRTKWAEVNLLWRRQRAAMQPFLFGKQPAAPTSSRNVVQTYDEAVASGTLILTSPRLASSASAAPRSVTTGVHSHASSANAAPELAEPSARKAYARDAAGRFSPRRSASEPPPSLAPTRRSNVARRSRRQNCGRRLLGPQRPPPRTLSRAQARLARRRLRRFLLRR